MCARCISLVFTTEMSKLHIHFHWSVLETVLLIIRHFSVLLFWKSVKSANFTVFTVFHNPVSWNGSSNPTKSLQDLRNLTF